MTQTTPNHTQTVAGWAAHDSSGHISPFVFKRRENGIDDVTIKILYCGMCHTDLHHIRNDWGITMYPVVPGITFFNHLAIEDQLRQWRSANAPGAGSSIIRYLILALILWEIRASRNGARLNDLPMVENATIARIRWWAVNLLEGHDEVQQQFSGTRSNVHLTPASPAHFRHEITGVITKVGSNVSGFKVGEKVGVGCLTASCLKCEFCMDSQENYCDNVQFTYNGIFWDGSITYGGYSEMLIANKRYVVKIPDSLPLDAAAPLLCAGITVFSPMKRHNMLQQPGKKLGVVGLGGLGHVAVKFGKAFGLHVTVISTSPSKETEARERLGADDFLVSSNNEQMQAGKRSLDFIVDTVSARHNLGPLLELLKVSGTLVFVGAPDKPVELPAFPLIFGQRVISGSMIGGMKETQEMMDLCGKHNITCDIELIKPDYINTAVERLTRNDVRYRFVIDITANESKL